MNETIGLLEGIEFWHWWVLGALFVTAEAFIPTTVLLWPGIAAAIVGLVVLAIDDIGWRYQLLLFVVLSVACLYLWSSHLKAKFGRPGG